ncbi:MAG TPA: extracellular solute-binding protein, partial [Clostridia bacterium]|nr:extracellular solute-binding protein [Clostridia bacterium]
MKKLALVLVVMMLVTCFTFASAEENVTISYTSWALAEEHLVPVYGGSCDAFMADNPDITVDYSQTNPYGDYLNQLKISAANGTAPYVAHIKAEWLPELLEMGVVKDIKPYVSADVVAEYNPATIAAVSNGDAMVAMPWFGNTYAMYCNTALMEQAGIKEMPTTWEELLDDAYAISDLGEGIYGLAIPNSNGVEAGEGYNILPILWAYGADYRDAEGKLALNSENAVKAFECIKALIDDGVSTTVGNSFKDLRRLFGEGKIGFYWDLEATIKTAASAAANEDEF